MDNFKLVYNGTDGTTTYNYTKTNVGYNAGVAKKGIRNGEEDSVFFSYVENTRAKSITGSAQRKYIKVFTIKDFFNFNNVTISDDVNKIEITKITFPDVSKNNRKDYNLNFVFNYKIDGVDTINELVFNELNILKINGFDYGEHGIYRYQADCLFSDIFRIKNNNINDFLIKRGKTYEIKELEIEKVNLNEPFYYISYNKNFFKKSFKEGNTKAYNLVNDLVENTNTIKVAPLYIYNGNSEYSRPTTNLIIPEANLTINDFEDFLYHFDSIKNVYKIEINTSNLVVGNVYTGSDVLANVTCFFKLDRFNNNNANSTRNIIISAIKSESNVNELKISEEYKLTFNLVLSGESGKNFYKLLKVADDSTFDNDGIVLNWFSSYMNNKNEITIDANKITADYSSSTIYNEFTGEYITELDSNFINDIHEEDFLLGILEEVSEQDYKSGLRALVNSLIKKYSIEKQDPTETEAVTTFLEEDKFYNHIAGGMPRVEVTFVKKNYKDKTNDLNASNPTTGTKYVTGLCPYIKSMSLTDNGVKKLKLVLWDRDFGSYNEDKQPLEQVIREAIAYNSCNPEAKEENRKQGPENDSDVNSVSYLDIVKIDTNSDTTNLKLRFGFDDYNIPLTSGNRSNRAWELIKSEEEKTSTTIFNPYYKLGQNGMVVNKPDYNSTNINFFVNVDTPIGAPIKDDETNLQEEQQQKKEKNINRQRLVNKSADQTTRLSLEMDFMIVGYKTSLQKNGIIYEIEAIESSSIKTLNYSILQRFEDITGTPSEVLYTLMRLFNENADGVLNRKAPKIYFDSDDIVEEVDKEAYRNTSITIPEKADASTINKKISISLGGQNSYYNYNETDSDEQHIRYYKNIGSLISEFCAACPPKKEVKRSAKTYIDKNTAETVTIENNSEGIFRPLQWYTTNVTFKDENDKEENVPCIFLYYRRVNKINKIRKYNWGPGLAGKNSVVLDLQIENANEFAVMSAVSVFNLETGSSTTYGSNGASTVDNEKVDNGKIVSRVTGGAITSDAYENAYNNCLYQGSITILGDPFYTFDNFLQPCSYPIYLNIEVPVSEYELRNKKENDIYFNKVNNNVRKHYLSGYYVVKAITHNITDGNFTTTLDIMSYPGIANDINIVQS